VTFFAGCLWQRKQTFFVKNTQDINQPLVIFQEISKWQFCKGTS